MLDASQELDGKLKLGLGSVPEELRFEILNILLAQSQSDSWYVARRARSERVRRLGLQHVVSHLVFTTDDAVMAFAQYLKDPPPITGYDPASTVCSILLAPPTDYATGHGINILNQCLNIKRIALSAMRFQALFNPGSLYCYSNIVPAIFPQRGHELEITILDDPKWTSLVPSPSIANITHLHFAASAPPSFPYFALESLTHVAIPIHQNFSQSYEFLAIPTLKYFVVLLPLVGSAPELRMQVENTRRCDPRVLLLEYDSEHEVIHTQWENQARGTDCLWRCAIQFTQEWEARIDASRGELAGMLLDGTPNNEKDVISQRIRHFQGLDNLRKHWPRTYYENVITPTV